MFIFTKHCKGKQILLQLLAVPADCKQKRSDASFFPLPPLTCSINCLIKQPERHLYLVSVKAHFSCSVGRFLFISAVRDSPPPPLPPIRWQLEPPRLTLQSQIKREEARHVPSCSGGLSPAGGGRWMAQGDPRWHFDCSVLPPSCHHSSHIYFVPLSCRPFPVSSFLQSSFYQQLLGSELVPSSLSLHVWPTVCQGLVMQKNHVLCLFF